jgi:hypothetical protein
VISGSVTTPKASLIKAYKLIYFKIICQPFLQQGGKEFTKTASNTDTPIVITVIWIYRFINGGNK